MWMLNSSPATRVFSSIWARLSRAPLEVVLVEQQVRYPYGCCLSGLALLIMLGDANFEAMILQVATLMPVRTIMNYQVRTPCSVFSRLADISLFS